MEKLQNLIWVERFRPKNFDELILEEKSKILKYLENPVVIPSFIFFSNQPGTGKTSAAYLIANYLKSDLFKINSSMDRGIDKIREDVSLFAQSLSSNENSKRCVFMDEADGMTRQAQDSLRNLMEEYSDNCFFIFTANDLSKIIEPIRSRCQLIDFSKPSEVDIFLRLEEICKVEDIKLDINGLVQHYYPDIRSMVKSLQECKISGVAWKKPVDDFEMFFDLMKKKDIEGIYTKVYSGNFDILQFNKLLFHKIFREYKKYPSVGEIALRLADTERSWNLNINLEIVFISNILQIIKYL